MKIKILELGQVAKHIPTGLTGMLTHAVVDMEVSIDYIFQPRGVVTETGRAMNPVIVKSVEFKNPVLVEVEFPIQVLGTLVEDTGTGIKGMATNIIFHIDGCIHVDVQPAGLNGSGQPIPSFDCNILRLKGKAIKELTKEEQAKERIDKPSPAPRVYGKYSSQALSGE